jgi:hypothetical protein
LRAVLEVGEMGAALNAKFELQSVNDLTLRVIRLVGFIELEDDSEQSPTTSTNLRLATSRVTAPRWG